MSVPFAAWAMLCNLKHLYFMNETAIIMVGKKKSDCQSPFAVFETFKAWTHLREIKVIQNGFYFAVLVLQDKQNADIHPDLFVQGYRPHSSFAKLYVDKRRYGRFVKAEEKEYCDDVVFAAVQLYQIMGAREVRLVLKNGESHDLAKVTELAGQICQELKLELLGNLRLVEYYCPVSSGYFLANYHYKVWAAVVGERNGLKLDKKALIFDYETGIPGVVEYDDRHFETIE